MKPQIVVQEWVKLPNETRHKLVTIFGLNRTHGVQMQDNRVISDGYSYEELSKITVEAMQAFLNDFKDSDFFTLWEKTLTKVSNELNVKYDSSSTRPPSLEAIQDIWKSKLTALVEEAKTKNLSFELKKLVKEVFEIKQGRPSK